MKNGLLIGCHQGLTIQQINYIHKKIINFLNKSVINKYNNISKYEKIS